MQYIGQVSKTSLYSLPVRTTLRYCTDTYLHTYLLTYLYIADTSPRVTKPDCGPTYTEQLTYLYRWGGVHHGAYLIAMIHPASMARPMLFPFVLFIMVCGPTVVSAWGTPLTKMPPAGQIRVASPPSKVARLAGVRHTRWEYLLVRVSRARKPCTVFPCGDLQGKCASSSCR